MTTDQGTDQARPGKKLSPLWTIAPAVALIPNALVFVLAEDPDIAVKLAQLSVRITMTAGVVLLARQVFAGRDEDGGAARALLVWTVLLATTAWSADHALIVWTLFGFQTCGILAWIWSRVALRLPDRPGLMYPSVPRPGILDLPVPTHTGARQCACPL